MCVFLWECVSISVGVWVCFCLFVCLSVCLSWSRRMIYLIGQNFGGQKCQISRTKPKILSAEIFCQFKFKKFKKNLHEWWMMKIINTQHSTFNWPGMSETRTGILTGMTFAVSTVAAPLWGMMSDITGRQKLILSVLCVVAASSLASVPLVSSTFANPSNHPGPCVTSNINNNNNNNNNNISYNHINNKSLQNRYTLH